MSDSAPGWQPDPTGKHDHRYWDGSQWTDNVSNAGVASTDAYEPSLSGGTGDLGDPTLADAPVVADEPAPPAPLDPTVITPAPPAPDATAAWATTSSAPAPPPPYVPTNPVSSGGGSKNRLLMGGAILAAVAIAVVAFLALGGNDDKSVRAQLASALQRETDLSKSDADCAADFFVDELGEDAFAGADFDGTNFPPELEAAFAENGAGAIEKCNLDESALGGAPETTTDGSTDGGGGDGTYGSDPALDALYDDCEAGDYVACDELYFTSPMGSEYEDFGDSCGDRNEPAGECVEIYGDGSGGLTDGFSDSSNLPDNFEEILADTYEETFGITREQAECLASKLKDAVEDGSINEEQVMTEFLDYLSDCDISLEEIGAN